MYVPVCGRNCPFYSLNKYFSGEGLENIGFHDFLIESVVIKTKVTKT